MTQILKLDLQHARHIYVVGDIHGAFTKLQTKLDQIGFDGSQDYLLSVGDLVDRGKDSHMVLDWLDQPWFYAVQGNHEQMIYSDGMSTKDRNANGQQWFKKLYYKDIDLYRKIPGRLRALPIAMEVTLPDTSRIGVIHACVPGFDWNYLDQALMFPKGRGMALWDRDQISDVLKADNDGYNIFVQGIDHVFYGHTPLSKPFTNGNQSWIDTGAYWKDNEFTVVKVN